MANLPHLYLLIRLLYSWKKYPTEIGIYTGLLALQILSILGKCQSPSAQPETITGWKVTTGSVKKDTVMPASTCHRLLQRSEGGLIEGNAHPLKVLLGPQGPRIFSDSPRDSSERAWTLHHGMSFPEPCAVHYKRNHFPPTCVWDELSIQIEWRMIIHDF